MRQPTAGASVRQPQPIAATMLARVLGVVLVVLAAAGLYWLTTTDRFRVNPQAVPISGLAYTNIAEVRQKAGLDSEAWPNVFRIKAAAMVEAIRSLPSVESADVNVALPNRLEISVHEREPLLLWRSATASFLVDATGALLAQDLSAGGLPIVVDLRAASSELVLGGRIDAVDLAAARLLLTITPADVGSRATALSLSVDDTDGYVLTADSAAWRAVFGFYTANQLRPDDRVPRQRQCLASILAGGEDGIDTVYLAIAGDTCGTFRDRPTPSARSLQNVGRPVT